MIKIPEFVKIVLTELEAAGYEAWCVGGCVRDVLLGKAPDDWDVTTNALPEETLALFGQRALPTGLQHGTVTVKSSGQSIEVTTYRIDGEYRDHRRPDSVTFTRSLKEDLLRRDFTVNAMAMSLWGELYDPFGGQQDLRNGILRCVGEPDCRFEEDALRILRGLRFAAVLELEILQETAESIHRKRHLLADIAPERIQVELLKLLRGKSAGKILRQFPDVLGVFWSEILPMVGMDQKNHHHCYDVWEHTLHAVEAVPADEVLRMTMLLHDVGKPEKFTVDAAGVGHFYGHSERSCELADEMLRRLKVSAAFRETVVRLVAWHDREIPRTETGVRRALLELGEEDLRRLLEIKRADNLAQAPAYRETQKEIDLAEEILERQLAQEHCFSLKQLAVKGTDLLELGYRGPVVGQLLAELLDGVVDGVLPNDREILLEEIRRRQR